MKASAEEERIRKILIIEDDRDYRNLLKTYLTKYLQDIEIIEYDPVSKGAPSETFDWSPYDILILDYYLCIYGLTGLDLLQKYRKQPGFPATLMITGAGDEEIAVRALNFGVYEFLRKEKLTRESLIESVKNAFSKHRGDQVKVKEQEKVSNAFDKTLFYRELEHPVDNADRALLLVDVDNMDSLTSEFGFIVHDNLLRHFARSSFDSLKSIYDELYITRLTDSSVAILIKGVHSGKDLEKEIQGLCDYFLQHSYVFEDKPVDCTVSIGVLILDEKDNPIDYLLKAVNQACEIARQISGNSSYIITLGEIRERKRKQQEEEKQRTAERQKLESERKQLADEKRKLEAEEQKRLEELRQREEEEKRKEEEEENKLREERKQLEEERQRLQDEKRKLEAEEQKRLEQLRQREVDAKRKEEARRRLEVEKRQKAEKEKQLRIAEAERKRKEEEKRLRQLEIERQQKENEAKRKAEEIRKRREEEQRLLAEKKEKLRQAEEERKRKEEKLRKLEEQSRKAEELRRKEKEAKLKEEELRHLEEVRRHKRKGEEKQQLEQQKKTSDPEITPSDEDILSFPLDVSIPAEAGLSMDVMAKEAAEKQKKIPDKTETEKESGKVKEVKKQVKKTVSSEDEVVVNESELNEKALTLQKAFNENRGVQTFQPIVPMFTTETEITTALFRVGVQIIDINGNVTTADEIKNQNTSISLQQFIDRWLLREMVGRIVNNAELQSGKIFIITISEAWLKDITLFNWLKKLLTGLENLKPGKSIALEIPATMLTEHEKRALPLINALKKTYGFRIALGDINSIDELSKLSGLLEFKLFTINYNLTEELGNNAEESEKLIKNLKKNGARLVIDGIEDSAMLTTAISNGADYVTGNFIGGPETYIADTGNVESLDII